MYKQIGIVGQGFVGTAVRKGFQDTVDIHTYDKYKPADSNCITLSELCNKAKIIFVCVPTPMNQDKTQDISIVKSVVDEINDQSVFDFSNPTGGETLDNYPRKVGKGTGKSYPNTVHHKYYV